MKKSIYGIIILLVCLFFLPHHCYAQQVGLQIPLKKPITDRSVNTYVKRAYIDLYKKYPLICFPHIRDESQRSHNRVGIIVMATSALSWLSECTKEGSYENGTHRNRSNQVKLDSFKTSAGGDCEALQYLII